MYVPLEMQKQGEYTERTELWQKGRQAEPPQRGLPNEQLQAFVEFLRKSYRHYPNFAFPGLDNPRAIGAYKPGFVLSLDDLLHLDLQRATC